MTDGTQPMGAEGTERSPFHPSVRRGEVLWAPPADAWSTTALGRFARLHGLDDFAELIHWSIADIDRFWAASTEFTGVRWTQPPIAIRDGTRMPGVRWFPGATLNYADQALRVLADHPRLEVVSRDRGNRPVTRFEQQALDAGRTSCDVVAVRRPAG